MKTGHCFNCGYTGLPKWEGIGITVIALLVWLVPIVFLSLGYWPFFLILAIALSAWAIVSVRLICPVCKSSWRTSSAKSNKKAD